MIRVTIAITDEEENLGKYGKNINLRSFSVLDVFPFLDNHYKVRDNYPIFSLLTNKQNLFKHPHNTKQNKILCQETVGPVVPI